MSAAAGAVYAGELAYDPDILTVNRRIGGVFGLEFYPGAFPKKALKRNRVIHQDRKSVV
jgi:hypothetical protein